MKFWSFSRVVTSGFGRRIIGLFLLAGILPVLVTAGLAYIEVESGLEKEVNRNLREHSKTYGMEILERIIRSAEKAEEFISFAERNGVPESLSFNYLLGDFDEITVYHSSGATENIVGDDDFDLADMQPDKSHLASGSAQMVIAAVGAKSNFYLLRAGSDASSIYAFRILPDKLWGLKENTPYLTGFCAFGTTGELLHCTEETESERLATVIKYSNAQSEKLAEWTNLERDFVAAEWQLFLDAGYRYPLIDIVAFQPKSYALRSGADFRSVFAPALALVVVIVGLLSFSLIGDSLVPLQRLTLAARQIASGRFDSRVKVGSQDEFGTLANTFNDMAGRIDRQIHTMKAMSKIDRLILAGIDIEAVSEGIINHLIELTGVEAAAVIAKDADAPRLAKMISWFQDDFVHERISLPRELGHDLSHPRQLNVIDADDGTAPYRQRFLSFGVKFVLIIPVFLKEKLTGILLLGSDTSFEMHGELVKVSVDIAGRLAVALTSSEREEALYRQAHFDELTGLPNRQLFKDRLGQHLTQALRDEHPGAMLFIDLDRFKDINDVFGHSVGDIVLAQTAERILAEVTESDTVARLGGDEFVIIMPNTDSNSTIRKLADRILFRLGESFSVRGNDHYLGASIGIVVFPGDGGSVETLLKNADSAMYRAKAAGRSCFEFFSKELNAESRRKIELERDLREAFEARALTIHYQPQFDLQSGNICGAEALLRWKHATYGYIPPSEFVQLAEDSGLIVEIGRWVLDQTCEDLRAILDKGLHPGSMSVNVSARQLRETRFAQDVLDALHRNGINPGYMQLEITETTVAQNRDTAISILRQVREAGVQVSIDDFGTGYSSLSYLQQLPFDCIKIDKSFIDLIGAGGNSEKICRTIIKMANELDKKSIAEGVETKEQAEFLMGSGCNSVQGFYYCHPLSRKDFFRFIEEQGLHTQRRKALEIAT